jgi:hypothetical protein
MSRTLSEILEVLIGLAFFSPVIYAIYDYARKTDEERLRPQEPRQSWFDWSSLGDLWDGFLEGHTRGRRPLWHSLLASLGSSSAQLTACGACSSAGCPPRSSARLRLLLPRAVFDGIIVPIAITWH